MIIYMVVCVMLGAGLGWLFGYLFDAAVAGTVTGAVLAFVISGLMAFAIGGDRATQRWRIEKTDWHKANSKHYQ